MFKKTKNQPPTSRRPAGGSKGGAPVYSYYGNRSSIDPKQPGGTKKARPGFKWQLIPSFIAAIMIVGSLIYASGLDTNPRLKVETTDSAALLQNDEVYTAAAREMLQDSIFNRSKLLINTKTIERQMLEKFPELKTVGITIPLTSRRPIVTIKAIEPRLLLINSTGSYIIDSNGQAALKVNDTVLADNLGLPKVQDETGLEIKLGHVTLTAREAAFIGELGYQLAAKSITINSLSLPPLANELHLRLDGQPYFVKFNMLGDPREQAGSFVATKERLEADKIRPGEYIDVRVEEKVFYK